MNDTIKDTKDHIRKVRDNLFVIRHNLEGRGIAHDLSKLEEPEISGYESLQKSLQGVQYGTPDYRAALGAHEGVIKHHYACNNHHPEHWPNGIADMSLLDIIEMLADWKAAGERTKGGNLQTSIEFNIKRFGIGEQLAAILMNTAKELGWIDG